jgi:glycosyltransferase involved in cell wall biosynthesis
MNILHVVPYYEPAWSYGGVVRAVTGLARQQVSSGHYVTVLTTDTAGPGDRLTSGRSTLDGVVVERLPNLSNLIRAKLNLSTPVSFRRVAPGLIEEYRIELIHCHELRTLENLRIGPIAQRFDLPLVLSPHGTLPYTIGRGLIKKSWDHLFGRKLLHRFDHVLALSEQEASEVRVLWSRYGIPLGADQLTVAPNGIHPGDFEKLPDRGESRCRWNLGAGPVAIFLGRLSRRKGLDLLIPAFADLVSQSPAARLLLAGPDDGVERQLRDLAVRCGINAHLVFTGMLNTDAKLAALRAADVFILPAEGEGSSMAVLEAMACELPLILTPGCHFPEVATAGAGLVVPREIACLADALRTLSADSERRLLMGQRARKLVFGHYTWPRLVTRLDSAYQAALARRHSKSRFL